MPNQMPPVPPENRSKKGTARLEAPKDTAPHNPSRRTWSTRVGRETPSEHHPSGYQQDR